MSAENLGLLLESLIEELYILHKTIIHIHNLSDVEEAYIAGNDVSNQGTNTQLDYFLSIINRERYDNETDTEVRTRLNDFVESVVWGGTLEGLRSAITYKYPTISSGDIKINEPTNIYADADTCYYPFTASGVSYIERPPDQIGYTDSNTTRYYIGGASPSGDYDWRPLIWSDATEFASYQLQFMDIHSGIVSGASGATEVLYTTKINTPFTGLEVSSDSDKQNGYYYRSDSKDITISDLTIIENPFLFQKFNTGDKVTYDVTEVATFLPLTAHYSQFELT